MKNVITILISSLFFFSCKKEYKVDMPDPSNWDLFKNPAAQPLNYSARKAMEGVYDVSDGNDVFGGLTAVKWSYIITDNDTILHVSGFFGQDIAYFICEGKQLNGEILLNGYWRKMVSTETGIIRFTINDTNGAALLLGNTPVITSGSIKMDGKFGFGQQDPQYSIILTYNRPLNNTGNFNILAHRSGGRNSDLLPVSENSVEMILKTAEFGSTGIEIDVRFTKDGVPILYHDNDLNLRLVQKCGLVGPIENYTYAQLNAFVRLIHGERIPTLRQALSTALYRTQLTFVWLDTKYIGSLEKVQELQFEFMELATGLGRKFEIVIGLPGEDQYNNFLSLPDYSITPSLCELSIADAARANSKIWAPRFTEGTQNENVAAVHAQGRRVFVWTLDVPEFIEQYIREGHFDGILSNFPSCTAYNYYVRQ